MQVFVVAVSVALIVSFMCSIFESVLLSLNHAQVELLAAKGKASGRILKAFVDAQWLAEFDARLAAYRAQLEEPEQAGHDE